MLSKTAIIDKVFNDPSGHGSINATLKDAKVYDDSITYDDVKQWKEKNTERKLNLRGTNSFIANKPYEEFQMDLMFFSDLHDKDYDGALLVIDIFTKYISVIPIKNKQIDTVLNALKEAIVKMGGKPLTIYSDNEGAFVSNIIQKYFKDNNIRHIVTQGHAPYAERSIRTIKQMIYDRLKGNMQWHSILFSVLLTYNRKMVSRITKMTPNDAMKQSNHLDVRLNLEMHRKSTRKYPNVAVGDHVKIYKKKDKLDKQQKSVWTPNYYTVESISESMGQKFFKLEGERKQYMRHEILLI